MQLQLHLQSAVVAVFVVFGGVFTANSRACNVSIGSTALGSRSACETMTFTGHSQNVCYRPVMRAYAHTRLATRAAHTLSHKSLLAATKRNQAWERASLAGRSVVCAYMEKGS